MNVMQAVPPTVPSVSQVEALRVQDLHKSYGPIAVLKGVSLTANEHDVVAVLGSSGSGKSTLLRCINMLTTPDSGDVFIRGERIAMRCGPDGRQEPADRCQVERMRRRLGMVFQQFNLWAHMTVLQNLIEAPIHVLRLSRREAIERADAMLAKVGLSDKRDAYPAQLSGGQQQRVGIARALCMEPSVMLFDEPTSALDPELVGEVLAVMRDLAKEGRTMLVVTHEMAFARQVASRIVFLHHGRVEEEGAPDDVFLRPQSERCRKFLSRMLPSH